MTTENTEAEQDGPQFSRGMSGPFGPFTEPVKTLVDERTFEMWLRYCHQKGTTSSEYLRDIVYLLVHGTTPAEMVSHDRRADLQTKGLTEVRSVRVAA
jgi:hypothetical protein